MMGLEYIKALSEDAGKEAKWRGLEPKVVNKEDESLVEEIRSIPNLGTYVPKGWEMVEEHFVDSSGFGSPGEPALTFEQFTEVVMAADPDHGFGLTQTGQFQVYIGEFRREV